MERYGCENIFRVRFNNQDSLNMIACRISKVSFMSRWKIAPACWRSLAMLRESFPLFPPLFHDSCSPILSWSWLHSRIEIIPSWQYWKTWVGVNGVRTCGREIERDVLHFEYRVWDRLGTWACRVRSLREFNRTEKKSPSPKYELASMT